MLFVFAEENQCLPKLHPGGRSDLFETVGLTPQRFAAIKLRGVYAAS